jgi:hypothetical protein
MPHQLVEERRKQDNRVTSLQITKYKIQITNKSQIQNYKYPGNVHGVWILLIGKWGRIPKSTA